MKDDVEVTEPSKEVGFDGSGSILAEVGEDEGTTSEEAEDWRDARGCTPLLPHGGEAPEMVTGACTWAKECAGTEDDCGSWEELVKGVGEVDAMERGGAEEDKETEGAEVVNVEEGSDVAMEGSGEVVVKVGSRAAVALVITRLGTEDTVLNDTGLVAKLLPKSLSL